MAATLTLAERWRGASRLHATTEGSRHRSSPDEGRKGKPRLREVYDRNRGRARGGEVKIGRHPGRAYQAEAMPRHPVKQKVIGAVETATGM